MKKSLILCGGIFALNLVYTAGAAVVIDNNWTVSAAIPDGNPVGITAYQTYAGLDSAPITDVSVNLNISGGYNGDLVGYLTLQDASGHTATEILLNRVGTTAGNPFGSAGAGFNVTLSDGGAVNGTVHNAVGVPTGLWQPDSASTLGGTFGGLTANGTWTLFLADLSVGGGTSVLNSWGLNVTTVPEPSVFDALAGVLMLAGSAWRLRRK